MLSRATSSKNLKLLNFTPSSITVNESALLEINHMRSESTVTIHWTILKVKQIYRYVI